MVSVLPISVSSLHRNGDAPRGAGREPVFPESPAVGVSSSLFLESLEASTFARTHGSEEASFHAILEVI